VSDRIRALIVDDEPLAREVLRAMLAGEEDIEVVGEADDGNSALTLLDRLAPDLLFLDVQMPERDGFAVLREMRERDPDRSPVVVFVTAFDQYAIRAFEVHALDYLLKPFDEGRLGEALRRARVQVGRGLATTPDHSGDGNAKADLEGRLRRLLDEVGAARPVLERIVVREGERVFFVRAADVEWFEAAGKHVTVHVSKQQHHIREGFGRLEASLDPRRFTRISRSAIVNIDRIREMKPWFQGEYVVVLSDGTRLVTTRGYRDNLHALLGRERKER
jgi:two-component system, LytTR family, response regulator